MAITLSDDVRNALLSDIRTRCAGGIARAYTGSRPATPSTAATGTLLAEVVLGSPAFSVPSAFTITLLGTPLEDASANNAGNVGYMRFFASDGTTGIYDASVTAVGGGGDVEATTVVVGAGVPFRIVSHSLTKAA